METVLKGVTSVNNPASNYITGNDGETSAQFRRRRNLAMSVPSQGFTDSIESQMLNMSGVSQCKVYDNKTNSAVDGIPAHGVWVIVEGGQSDDIGQIIYNNLPPGIPMKGTQEVDITKPNGETVTLKYDLPTPATLYIKANVQAFDGSLDVNVIKNQLLQELDFNIQERADSAIITTMLKDIIGDMGTVYGVLVSLDNTTWAEYITPSGKDEFLQATSNSITLTEV